ncbi:CinA family protein [uncultured Mucilaginibacter sp.]|uniref:CinA family protein n=1 Tax=uncultured Mucilaginibacter sp. TaxID=797541 RepID=UPI0025EC7E76|nr:CinA family protein [uncultured Mucilaginibacter sp.]
MAEKRIETCSNVLAQHGLTIAFAESATAGWLCSEFALTPESGSVLKGGIVCYDASLKESLLGISHDIIQQFTPESQEVTDQLALKLKALIPSDIQVGVTGLTTAGGSETDEKPVGTMFVSMLIKDQLISKRFTFSGNCEEIIHHTINAAADMLIEHFE